MGARLIHGDMLEVLGKMVADGGRVHSVVTDPPYHLTNNVGTRSPYPGQYTPIGKPKQPKGGFMGKQWDGGDIAFRADTWRLCWELLPPGGHLLAFSGTRTYHRMATAIEDAGFEIRDTIAWLYGSGFPKSKNIGGGRGTALKPAMEPICLARKPLVGTVAGNVAAHGTGALNIDACRVGVESTTREKRGGRNQFPHEDDAWKPRTVTVGSEQGRWPANVVHDGSDEVVSAFPGEAGAFAPVRGTEPSKPAKNVYGEYSRGGGIFHADSGSAARFFYSAKADADDRLGSKHPTVKPVDLMRWLVRLITPPGGTVLDPFAGSGTTGMACMAEGFDCILIEREAEYAADITRRLAHVKGEDTPLFGTGASA